MNYMRFGKQVLVPCIALIIALSACAARHDESAGVLCDRTIESFGAYPDWNETVPDGNFAIIAGRVSPAQRTVVTEVDDYDPKDTIYGSNFAPVSGPLPKFTYPLPAGFSASNLKQSVLPALKAKTKYFWKLSPALTPCSIVGVFVTQ